MSCRFHTFALAHVVTLTQLADDLDLQTFRKRKIVVRSYDLKACFVDMASDIKLSLGTLDSLVIHEHYRAIESSCLM